MLILSKKRIGDRNGIFIVGNFFGGRVRTFDFYTLQAKREITMVQKQVARKGGGTAAVFCGAPFATGGMGLSI